MTGQRTARQGEGGVSTLPALLMVLFATAPLLVSPSANVWASRSAAGAPSIRAHRPQLLRLRGFGDGPVVGAEQGPGDDASRRPSWASRELLCSDGVHLAYQEAQCGTDGPDRTLVLLHDFGLSSRVWGKSADALASGARVVALDHRSHGRNSVRPTIFARSGIPCT